ncbi:MAG TPA: AAA family ATPase, partial [Clostridiaceae bacterium]|nr:AAA family ATPase [Clostridiaceae bacterium]
MEDRIVATVNTAEDSEIEYGHRPQKLRDYVGQRKVKEKLDIFIRAAQMREEALDHVLLYGPPGLGKTTLANIITREMGGTLKVTSG